MKRDIVTSAIGIVVLTLLCGILYPLVITGVCQVAFPGNANGQKIYVDGKLVGSKIIGQQFADQVINKKTGKPEVDKNGNPVTVPDPRYFQSGRRRPSRPTTPPRPRSPTSAPTASRPSRRSRPTSRPTSRSRSRMTPA